MGKGSVVASGRKGFGERNADLLDQDLLDQDLAAVSCGHSNTLAEAASIRANPMISVTVGCSPRSSIEETTPMTGELRIPSAATVAGSLRTMSNYRK
jgi:hypothetical protein